MTTVQERVTVEELALLFAGDEYTTGYPTIELGVTICERTWPDCVTDLKNTIYGPWYPVDEIPLEERAVLARAYARYATRGQR